MSAVAVVFRAPLPSFARLVTLPSLVVDHDLRDAVGVLRAAARAFQHSSIDAFRSSVLFVSLSVSVSVVSVTVGNARKRGPQAGQSL
jgi:hypothetical protein